jgi:ABC-type multidrug transport system permease subunit
MNLRPYLAYIGVNLKLTWRDRTVIFFNVLFPLLFFFIFAELARAEQGGAIKQVYASVVIIGVLGNGFFGGGIRAVVERENNILRRFKVAPISPAPILVSAATVGLITFLPTVLLLFAISHFRYGMPLPDRWVSALAMIVAGTVAFRTMGQIIASVANSMAEYQIIVQTLYFPMLFLSGSTFPVSAMPKWLQRVAQFLPSTQLYSGLQNILIRSEAIWSNLAALVTLAVTAGICLFLAMKLFRWEKEEKVKASAKLWLLAVLAPFALLGGWEAYSGRNLANAKIAVREVRRSRTLLFREIRVFTASGEVLPRAGVLIRDGRVERIYAAEPPDPKAIRAEAIDASGKTLLPALVDAGVTLMAPGGIPDPSAPRGPRTIERELAAYLFSGVAMVGSHDPAAAIAREVELVSRGETLGAIPVNRPAPPAPKSLLELTAALDAKSNVIAGVNLSEPVPDAIFTRMAESGVAFMPFLAATEARIVGPRALDRSLVEQAALPALLVNTRKQAAGVQTADPRLLEIAKANLARAYRAAVPLLLGTGSGAVYLIHGPAIHRELQLWVEAGVPAAEALRVATLMNARYLGAKASVEPGAPASLLIVNGNPLTEIAATEAIANVLFLGERVSRGDLFEEDEN